MRDPQLRRIENLASLRQPLTTRDSPAHGSMVGRPCVPSVSEISP
jgi:hypothetical protein